AVELDPEALALKVLDPPRPQVAGPVLLHPPPDRPLAQIVTGLLALDPLVPVLFLQAFLVNAFADVVRDVGHGGRAVGLARAGVHGHGPTFSLRRRFWPVRPVLSPRRERAEALLTQL